MTWIGDASVAVKRAATDESDDLAAPFFSGDVVAPDRLRRALANALRKKVARGAIATLEARAAFAAIEGVLAFSPTDLLSPRALSIALEIGHPVYDCVYLALAEATDMGILTADCRLINACRATLFGGGSCRWRRRRANQLCGRSPSGKNNRANGRSR